VIFCNKTFKPKGVTSGACLRAHKADGGRWSNQRTGSVEHAEEELSAKLVFENLHREAGIRKYI
jgi:hypothetical protein